MNNTENEIRKAVAAALRQNFYAFTIKVFETLNPGRSFKKNWHLRAIAHCMDLVRQGEVNQQIINIPPRSLKSTIVSVAWPAFLMGHDPAMKIMVVSHNQALAIQLSHDFRKIVQSAWYKDAFPTMQAAPVTDNETTFRTVKQGARYAVSVGSGVTGIGAEIIIIDDPVDASNAFNANLMASVNEWLSTALPTRHDNPETSKTVLVMQRLSVIDPTAFLQTIEPWHSLVLPVVAPEDMDIPIAPGKVYKWRKGEYLHPDHLTPDWLEKQRKRLGENAYRAQYLQAPVPYGGGAIDLSKIARWKNPPKHRDKRILSIDAASGMNKKSRTAIQLYDIVGDQLYLRHAEASHMDFPTAYERILRLFERNSVDRIILEKGGSGQSLAELLVKEVTSGKIKLVTPKMSKEERMAKAQVRLYDGSVLLPEKADWLNSFEEELSAFPVGLHDDQVDAFSQAINWNWNQHVPTLTARYTLITRDSGPLW